MDCVDSTETVVVGGGITGVCIASSLAARGATDVVVLEKENLAAGSTGKSAGVVETQYLDPFDVELRARSLRAYERIADETRADFTDVGYVRLLKDPETESEYRKSVRVQREFGIDDARILDPTELEALVPEMHVSDVHGALYGPSDGYADPYTMTQIFAERARDRGAEVRTGVTVTGVTTRGDEVTGVETDEGRVACETVVNAAGPWAPKLAADVGLDLPATPYRRQILVAEPDADDWNQSVPMVMEYTPAGSKPGLYFRSEGCEQLLLGLHREVTATETPANPETYPSGYDESFALELFERLERRAPAYTDFSVVNGWSGLYTITPDTHPILDSHPSLEGYYVATGFSGKGFQVGPAVGDILADLVLYDESRIVSDISPVRLDRFG